MVSANSRRDALTSLYGATDGARWGNNDNWLTGAQFGDWHGLTASSSNEVRESWLAKNGLKGRLPAELADLTHLRILRLHSEPGLTGPIPASLADLPNLGILDLIRVGFTGRIPPELARLDNLTTLYLYHLELSGPIPPEFGGFDALGELNIAGEGITSRARFHRNSGRSTRSMS